MKSKVKFDITQAQEPVIIASFEGSDDIRDKVALQFKNNLGYNQFLLGYFNAHGLSDNDLCIAPVGYSLSALELLRDMVETAIDSHPENKKHGSKV